MDGGIRPSAVVLTGPLRPAPASLLSATPEFRYWVVPKCRHESLFIKILYYKFSLIRNLTRLVLRCREQLRDKAEIPASCVACPNTLYYALRLEGRSSKRPNPYGLVVPIF